VPDHSSTTEPGRYGLGDGIAQVWLMSCCYATAEDHAVVLPDSKPSEIIEHCRKSPFAASSSTP
jgi:hypothetical protein